MLAKIRPALRSADATPAPQPARLVTPADIATIRGLVARTVRAWTLTHAGLALAIAGWTLLWGQALYGRIFVAQPVVAFVFFAGLALGAYDQRRRSRYRGHRRISHRRSSRNS